MGLEERVDGYEFLNNDVIRTLAVLDYYCQYYKRDIDMSTGMEPTIRLTSCAGHWGNGLDHMRYTIEFWDNNQGEIIEYDFGEGIQGKYRVPNLPKKAARIAKMKFRGKGASGRKKLAMKGSLEQEIGGYDYFEINSYDIAEILHKEHIFPKNPEHYLGHVEDLIESFTEKLFWMADEVKAGRELQEVRLVYEKDDRSIGVKKGDPYLGANIFKDITITNLTDFLQCFALAAGRMDELEHRTEMYEYFNSEFRGIEGGVDKYPGGGLCTVADRKKLSTEKVFGRRWSIKDLADFDVNNMLKTDLTFYETLISYDEFKDIKPDDEVDRRRGTEIFNKVVMNEFIKSGIILDPDNEPVKFSHRYVPVYVRAFRGYGTSDYLANLFAMMIAGESGMAGMHSGDLVDTLEKMALMQVPGGKDSSMAARLEEYAPEIVGPVLEPEFAYSFMWMIHEEKNDFRGMRISGSLMNLVLKTVASCSIPRMNEVFSIEQYGPKGEELDPYITTPMQELVKAGERTLSYLYTRGRIAKAPKSVADINFSFETVGLRAMISYGTQMARFGVKHGFFPQAWEDRLDERAEYQLEKKQ